ncbi:hypothetical protein FRC03_002465 [Tulasnella sp. 419]|nr:hypothetical protein FRC03_002465 [Tulasnella sp. 419]
MDVPSSSSDSFKRHSPSARRASLPSTSPHSATFKPSPSQFIPDSSRDASGNIYQHLNTYVFGSPLPSSRLTPRSVSRKSSSTTNQGFIGSSSQPQPDSHLDDSSDVGSAYAPEDDASLFHRKASWDLTRSSLSRLSSENAMDIDLTLALEGTRGLSFRREDKKRDRGSNRGDDDDPVTDEDDSARSSERAKMRAIDDGNRRPSLPNNVQVVSAFTNYSQRNISLADQTDPIWRASTSANPSTPTAATFAASTSFKPQLAISSNPDSGSMSTPLATPTATSVKSRPRSRSNRAAKPLPSLPANVGINPDWIPPWSTAQNTGGPSSETSEVLKLLQPSSSNSQIPPPVSMSSINPFTRVRSTTITQQSQDTLFTTGHTHSHSSSSIAPWADPTSSTAQPLPNFAKRSPSPPQPLPLKTSTSYLTDTSHSSTMTTDESDDPGQSVTADFDIDFILSGVNSDQGADGNFSLATPVPPRKASLAPSLEDSFARFVNQFDDEYGERRDKWSFMVEKSSTTGNAYGFGDYWHCSNMGRYWVGRELGVTGALDGLNSDNSIVVRWSPPPQPDSGKNQEREKSFSPPPSEDASHQSHGSFGGPPPNWTGHSSASLEQDLTPSQRRSNVRLHVKKHNRAPAFTLYLGPRQPRSVTSTRPSLLLAPKGYHFHVSQPPKPKVHSNDLGTPSSSSMSKKSKSLRNVPSMSSVAATLVGVDGAASANPISSSSKHQQHHPALPPSPPPVSLDLLSVAAATGRITSAHNQAFDTLSPEDGQAILEHLKHRSSLGVRLKRAFGGGNGNGSSDSRDGNGHTTSQGSGHSSIEGRGKGKEKEKMDDDYEGGKRSSSPGPSGSSNSGVRIVTKHFHHHHHHHHHYHVHHHYGAERPFEGAFEPPWMLMTPMYVKEAVIAAERSMYTGFAQLGLAAPPKKNRKNSSSGGGGGSSSSGSGRSVSANGPPSPGFAALTAQWRRNSILESVPTEAMCMVLPLWDLTLDMEEDKKKKRAMMDDLDIDLDDLEEEDEEEEEEEEDLDGMNTDDGDMDVDGGKSSAGSVKGSGKRVLTEAEIEAIERKRLIKELSRRRKLQPPPKTERKYLLTYYVPFNSKKQSMAHSTAAAAAAAAVAATAATSQTEGRSSKKRSRHHPSSSPGRPSSASAALNSSRRNSQQGHASSSSNSAANHLPVRSFRVVARILTPAELRDSGLSPPTNIVDPKRLQQQSASYYSSSLNYQRMDRRLSSSSILGESSVPSAFSAVIAVCHDRKRGVEFVPEGLDSLGLCGGETVMNANGTAVEKLPPLFPPAHMVPVSERRTPPLNAVGKQIVEFVWSGCLALTELGI